MLSKTAEKAIEFYGGASLWNNARKIDATVSAKGLAFKLKNRPFFENAKIELQVPILDVRIKPIGNRAEKNTAVLSENNVALFSEDNALIQSRENPRAYFKKFNRILKWDDLDMGYFANYAFWNYFTLPKLLLSDNIKWEEKKPGILKATFKDNFATHSKHQIFQFDVKSGALISHRYSADIISRFAFAANRVIEHKEQAGIRFPSHRVVTPALPFMKCLPFPKLIEFWVHDYKVI